MDPIADCGAGKWAVQGPARPAAYTIYIDGQAVQFIRCLAVSGDTAFCGTGWGDLRRQGEVKGPSWSRGALLETAFGVKGADSRVDGVKGQPQWKEAHYEGDRSPRRRGVKRWRCRRNAAKAPQLALLQDAERLPDGAAPRRRRSVRRQAGGASTSLSVCTDEKIAAAPASTGVGRYLGRGDVLRLLRLRQEGVRSEDHVLDVEVTGLTGSIALAALWRREAAPCHQPMRRYAPGAHFAAARRPWRRRPCSRRRHRLGRDHVIAPGDRSACRSASASTGEIGGPTLASQLD